MKKLFKNKIFKRIIATVLSLILLVGIAVAGINIYMVSSVDEYILTMDEVGEYDFDCVMVMGAGIWGTQPSPMLQERLDFGNEVYFTGCTDRILMTGDHAREEYDEVNIMKDCAIEAGVPTDNVFMDHAGLSTYESMYRARDVFQVEKMVIVTQKYHLYRAVYDARKLGIDAYGVAADKMQYGFYNNMREWLARVKDFIYCIVQPEPTYLGEAIPISASGSLTDDKERV